MKLLIITQKVNKNDPVLGFFHEWILAFSGHFELTTAICLEKGVNELPANIKVFSLGKEERHSRLQYVLRFFKYIWSQRKDYDAVLVHMNQEYVLLGGLFWLMAGKKVYMWRNHHAGSLLTDGAAWFCTKVFCTSKYSYTAKYKKTVIMPVGIDTDIFERKSQIQKIPRSILFLGRIAPVKKPDLLVEALIGIKKEGLEFRASFYGDPLSADMGYYRALKDKIKAAGLSETVIFNAGIPNGETVAVYNEHAIFVNLSSSGMYDKTIFEAMACETLVLASNENLRGLIEEDFIFTEGDKEELTDKLTKLIGLDSETSAEKGRQLRRVVLERHSLNLLSSKLFTELNT